MENREHGCLPKRAVSMRKKGTIASRTPWVNAGQKAQNSTTAAPNASQVAMTMYCTFSGCPEHIYESMDPVYLSATSLRSSFGLSSLSAPWRRLAVSSFRR